MSMVQLLLPSPTAAVTLVNNFAGFGGAIYAAMSGCVNVSSAVQVHGNTAKYSGGAAYQADSSTVSLSHGVSIKGNSAGQDGGGIAAVFNSTLNLGPGVQVTDNTAANNGGGVYTFNASRLTISCQSDPINRVAVTGNAAGEAGGGFCLFSELFPWQAVKAAAGRNTAFYGADYWIPTERLQLLNGTAPLNVTSRLDGSGLEFTVAATGCRDIPSALNVKASLQGVPLAALKTADTSGLATFQVPVRKPPGQYPLTFASALILSGSRKTVENVTILLNVQSCPKGDVMASTGDACITCVAGSYSLDPHNTTCDKCPDYAVCPGSWAVLPLEGFWSSSPYSAQIHR
jgi:predicted outer membrane repeat protein